ncbi:MAG: hypothetical protein PF961_14790 [Planctomycetota bacterium]|jgi:hypothetical protein|nr:hypothetical protein [Planctomycetota bacterium]
MPSSIRCLEGPHQGKELLLAAGKPLQLDVRRQGGVAGRLAFALSPEGMMFTNSSPVDSEVNGTVTRHAVLTDGDQVRVGKMVFEAHVEHTESFDESIEGKDETAANPSVAPSPTKQGAAVYAAAAPIMSEDPTPTAGSRTSRRISASRMAAVELPEPQREGLLKKVGKVFRRKDEADTVLDGLMQQRDELLQLAGRLALEGQGGLGLPAAWMQQLARGERPALGIDDLSPGQREAFLRHGELLRFLDAEIQARRNELGIGPDPTVIAARQIPLQAEHAERQESAFKAMDSMMTDEVQATTTAMSDPIKDDPEPAILGDGGSARRRGRRRRR